MAPLTFGSTEYDAKFAREALADARARGATPEELAPLVEQERQARDRFHSMFFAALRRSRPS